MGKKESRGGNLRAVWSESAAFLYDETADPKEGG